MKLVSAVSVCAVLLASGTAAAQDGVKPERYVQIGDAGGSVLNVPSKDGVVIEEVPSGTVVAVYGEKAGFLDAEVPGGIGVWIFGEYARDTEVPGVVEITGNNLTMRPMPSSEANSFPLRQKLHKGDRVRVITRADPKKPLAEDWVRVYSPTGTRAWIASADTRALAAGQDGQAQWRTAVEAALGARAAAAAKLEAAKPMSAAPGATAKPQADIGVGAGAATAAAAPRSSELAAAQERAAALLESLRTGGTEFEAARAAQTRVIELAPKGPQAELARVSLEEIATREEIARLKSDVGTFEGRRRDELAKAEDELRAINLKKDPLWGGRFQVRGWLERQTRDGAVTYAVRWSGDVTAEVVCTSGRYDLGVYEGSEVGIVGTTTRAATPGGIGEPARPQRIDAARIEVLSGRPSGR